VACEARVVARVACGRPIINERKNGLSLTGEDVWGAGPAP